MSILLCLCMVLALCPVTAFAEEGKTVSFTVTADKTEAQPGDTINFTLTMGAVDGLGGLWLELRIPEGLTFVEDSGTVTEGLETTMSASGIQIIQDSLFWIPECNYTSTADTVLMTFQCKVNADAATGAKTVGVGLFEDYEGYCFDVDGDSIAATFNPVAVTVSEASAPTPAITINGPDVVCAEENYFFTATASDGVILNKYFQYSIGTETGSADLILQDDGSANSVVAKDYYDGDSIELKVTGKTADGTPVSATKTVRISQEHVLVDGVCGCGVGREYTIIYAHGDVSIPAGTKKHGEPFTLGDETFTYKGYIQTGWYDDYGNKYELGGTYTLDEDMTFHPFFEPVDTVTTVTVPFTTTVALGDVGVPGEKSFTLAVIGDSAPDVDKSDVSITGSVTTNGKGSYNGTLTITGPERTLWYMLSEGAFVQQVDDGEAGWTVDDTVWGLLMSQAELSEDAATGYAVYVVPASIDDFGNYYIDWENLQTADMHFTNTYTAHAYELKHDATSHWDECDCGDIQNKEAHTYGDWKVTKEATQTAKGEKEHTCTVCGYTEKAEIPMRTVVLTGDDSSFALWAALFTLSAAVITTATVYKKKKADR